MQSIEQLPTADHFITHAQKMRDLLNLFPRGVDRLLLVIDPANPPEAVLAMIPWLADYPLARRQTSELGASGWRV
jgi:hypothetical protein